MTVYPAENAPPITGCAFASPNLSRPLRGTTPIPSSPDRQTTDVTVIGGRSQCWATHVSAGSRGTFPCIGAEPTTRCAYVLINTPAPPRSFPHSSSLKHTPPSIKLLSCPLAPPIRNLLSSSPVHTSIYYSADQSIQCIILPSTPYVPTRTHIVARPLSPVSLIMPRTHAPRVPPCLL